jgi:hypothetical protein
LASIPQCETELLLPSTIFLSRRIFVINLDKERQTTALGT